MSMLLDVPAVVTQPNGSRHAGTFPLFTETGFSDGVIGIRRFRRDDAPLMLEAVLESYRDLSTWLTWCRDRYSHKDSEAFVSNCRDEWDSGQSFCFAIVRALDGAFLGSVGLNQLNHIHKFANLGYWVRSGYTGQGVASASVRLVARFGLRELGFNRLEIVVPAGNRPSQRVAEKVGARREGVLRNRIVLRGRMDHAVMYSLVAEDLPAWNRQGWSNRESIR